jgi:hypothetical protein
MRGDQQPLDLGTQSLPLHARLPPVGGKVPRPGPFLPRDWLGRTSCLSAFSGFLAVALEQPESVPAGEGGRAVSCGDFLPAAFRPLDSLPLSPQPCRTQISPGRTLRYPPLWEVLVRQLSDARRTRKDWTFSRPCPQGMGDVSLPICGTTVPLREVRGSPRTEVR